MTWTTGNRYGVMETYNDWYAIIPDNDCCILFVIDGGDTLHRGTMDECKACAQKHLETAK